MYIENRTGIPKAVTTDNRRTNYDRRVQSPTPRAENRSRD